MRRLGTPTPILLFVFGASLLSDVVILSPSHCSWFVKAKTP